MKSGRVKLYYDVDMASTLKRELLFYSLKVVDRGSEAQLQVAKKSHTFLF